MIDRVKQHISDNRGKYGAVAGAGAVYGASQIPGVVAQAPILANQAVYNGIVKSNNLIQSGKEAVGVEAGPKVPQDEIDAVNGYYNSPLAKVYNPTPGQMMTSTANANHMITGAKDTMDEINNNIGDKFHQVKNYIIGESTMSEKNVQKINVKEALLEGCSAQEITEMAVHAGTVYQKNTPLGTSNRPELASSIKSSKNLRDMANGKGNRTIAEVYKIPTDKKFANLQDNAARLKSQQSNPNAWAGADRNSAAGQQPRLYQAAKQ